MSDDKQETLSEEVAEAVAELFTAFLDAEVQADEHGISADQAFELTRVTLYEYLRERNLL